MSKKIDHQFIGGIEHKRCPGCESWLPLLSFSVNRAQRDGLYPWCRVCSSRYNRKRNISKAMAKRPRPIPAGGERFSGAS